MKINWKQTK